jgi:hypothetical protein
MMEQSAPRDSHDTRGRHLVIGSSGHQNQLGI